MNILQNLTFDSSKPTTLSIRKTDKLNYLAVGLLEGQLLKKHQAIIPTLLTVLQGEIEFIIGDEHLFLKQADTYQIPVSVEHEVRGLADKNVFTLIQEKS